MTVETNAAHETATENADALATGTIDNPNPDFGNPSPTPAAPEGETVNQEFTEKPLSKREQIVANAKARREQEESAEGLEDLTTNDSGEFIPPFLRRQEEEARAAREAEEAAAEAAKPKRAADEPREFVLKVRGNDIPVASRGELVRLAEVEDAEAEEFTDAQLIKLAQKQVAASQVLDEAKLAKKTARAAAPDDDDTQPSSTPQHQDLDEEQEAPTRPNQDDRRRQLIEKIQFGDADEATQAFTEAVTEGVREAVAEQQFGSRFENVTAIIKKAGDEFEAANADLVNDPDFADILWNRAFVHELKKDLVGQGLAPENVNAVVGNDIRTAMKAYATIAADGRIKTRAPNQMLAAAATAVRQKFNRPAPQRGVPTTAARPTTAPMAHRQDMKRSLPQQPARASVPRAVAPATTGQTPAARSNVVQKMREARGQA